MTCTGIKATLTRLVLKATCLWTPLFNMGLIGSVYFLSMLSSVVFLTVVHSAAMRGQNEDFLNFLTDAFNLKAPTDRPKSEVLPEGPPNSGTAVVCSTSDSLDNSDEMLSMTAEPASVEFSDDSDYRRSKKKSRLTATLGQSPDNNSADSSSAELTYVDTHVNMAAEKQPSKTQDLASEDMSSQEMTGPWDSEAHHVGTGLADTSRGSEECRTTHIKEVKATLRRSAATGQSQTTKQNRKDQSETSMERESATAAVKQTSVSVPLNDRQNGAPGLEYMVSNRTMGYPNRANTSVGGPDLDLQRDKGIPNYESHLRRMCAVSEGLRTPCAGREQLDADSLERLNSELLDRDNSHESMEADMPTLTL